MDSASNREVFLPVMIVPHAAFIKMHARQSKSVKKMTYIRVGKLQAVIKQLNSSGWSSALKLAAHLENELKLRPKMVRNQTPPPIRRRKKPKADLTTCPPPSAR